MTENAEGMSSEHCGGSQSLSIGIGTSLILDAEASEFLSISDRALLRRCGTQETAQKNFHQVGDSILEVSTSVSRVDGHHLKLSSNLFDRALLRKYFDAASSFSSSSGTQPIENFFTLVFSDCCSFSSCRGFTGIYEEKEKVYWKREYEESKYLSRYLKQYSARTGAS